MNKKEFIQELVKKTGYSLEKCTRINDVLESNFLVGKKNKEKIIQDLSDRLEVSIEEANDIYNVTSSIIASGIKDKLKHPFKSLD